MFYDIARDMLSSFKVGRAKAEHDLLVSDIIVEGYNSQINEIRSKEYAHLGDNVYLDNAGLPVCAKSVVERASQLIFETVYGNPHSQSSVSQRTENLIEITRLQVLQLFNLDYMTHEVIFTQNATQGIKLLTEGFADTFGQYNYIYNRDSHTSVIGVRERASHSAVFETAQELKQDELFKTDIPTLVSWAGQSNFNGQRYPIEEWNSIFKEQPNVYTLLDASSLCGTAPPDLGSMASVPDFMCLSLYKMFGYPDLGCLIVNKKRGAEIFAGKKYFGGGTVEAVSVDGLIERSVNLSNKLEEGTLPIHSIIELSAAMSAFKDIFVSFEQVSKHVGGLTQYTINRLKSLRHDNDEQMVEVFASSDPSMQGPIVSFCLVSRTGDRLGYYDFEKFVSARRISLRTGSLCNAGSNSKTLGLTSDDLKIAFDQGHKCGDGQDYINGKVKGVVRVSFGAMSNLEDVDHLCNCINDFFQENFFTRFSNLKHSELTVKSMTIYPIKSCAGYSIEANKPWRVMEGGLEYDRQFCLLDPSTRTPLLLKNHPQMTLIKPRIDPLKKIMTLMYKDKSICIPLAEKASKLKEIVMLKDDKGTTYECNIGPELRAFFDEILKVPCLLARALKSGPMHNKSDFLLLSNSSLNYLQNYDKTNLVKGLSIVGAEFRGNLVVQGKDLKPFEEDNWNYININGLRLKNTEMCERCHMITINQETGERNTDVYVKLSKFRKLGGKILFGINCDIEEQVRNSKGYLTLQVGDKITVS